MIVRWISEKSIKKSVLDKDLQQRIILTFDDGPTPFSSISLDILDVLDRHDIKAAFCLIGLHVDKNPDIVRSIHAQGHELVNHGYHHLNFALQNYDSTKREIEKCDLAIGNAIGDMEFKTRYYRPPYGFAMSGTRRAMKETNKDLAYVTLWVNDIRVTSKNSTLYLRRLKNGIERQNGGCVVIHERLYNDPNKRSKKPIDKTWLPEALNEFIVWGKDQGYEFTCF